MNRTIFIAMALFLGITVNSNAYASNENTDKKLRLDSDEIIVDVLHDYVPSPNEMMNFNKPYVSRSSTILVGVTSPCDQYWRSEYPNNWMWQANRAITNADNMLSNKFGIELYSVSQKYWTSNNTDSSSLLGEVRSEFGLNDGAKMMIAFSGRTDGYTTGIATIGKPYALILDHQYEYNRETVQHELGHTYGLRHVDGDNSCVMTASGMGHIDTICIKHEKQWINNKYKY